jgi:ribonuclease VapC
MIVDSSVIMAMLLQEPERDEFVRILSTTPTCLMSAGNWVELGAVLGRRPKALAAEAENIVTALNIDIVPVTKRQAEIGHQAYREFGKGRGRARLNFGDCFAYALAKDTGLPLLFKGNDFIHTDIVPAL